MKLVKGDIQNPPHAERSRIQSLAEKIRVEKVHKLDLQPDDVLLITIGGYIGEDEEPWLPTREDLVEAEEAWKYALEGLGVRALVTHMLVKPTRIRAIDKEILKEYEKLRAEDP